MKKTKSVLFLAPYPVGKAPSQRLKYEQYYSYFEQAGYTLKTSSFIDEAFWDIIYKPGNKLYKIWFTLKGYFRRVKDLLGAGNYDLVYVHLWVTPFGFPIFERLLGLLQKNVVYDIDDLIYLGETGQSKSIIGFLKGRAKPVYLMKIARAVIVCTPKLEHFASNFNINVTDISSTINTSTYRQKTNYQVVDKIVLGWSGSHSTSKYLYLLKDVFYQLQKHIEFKLLVIGDANFELEGINVEAIPWNESNEVSDLSKIDIGLYPLPNEEWVLGKSGLKALQYMSLGIPTIATAIGANYRIIENGSTGFLIPPDHYDVWVRKILELVGDIHLRISVGSNARKRVVNHYSVEANKDTYLRIIEQVLSSDL